MLFILGRYYPRFGFSAELARKLALPFPGVVTASLWPERAGRTADLGSVRLS
jgi:predicted N-acetyltransferase YhbS